MTPDLVERARRIRLLILDVDGVMTDGGITIASDGSEIKTFHVRDGHGIKLLQRAGIEVAIISGRRSRVVEHRAAELGISLVYQGALDKGAAFDAVVAARGISPEEIAFLGDDVVDLPVLRRVGLAMAVADGVDELAPYMHYVTRTAGGRGAVREVAELILKAQGRWEDALRRYLEEPAVKGP